jgi:hypothetical protein
VDFSLRGKQDISVVERWRRMLNVCLIATMPVDLAFPYDETGV